MTGKEQKTSQENHSQNLLSPEAARLVKRRIILDRAKQALAIVGADLSQYVLKEQDFTYEKFTKAFDLIIQELNGCYSGRPSMEAQTYGLSNWTLTVKGYGLILRRDLIQLKFENARLKGLDSKDIVEIEQQFERASKEVESFLSDNNWVVT